MPLELVVNNPNGSTQRYAYQVGPGGHVLGLTTADGTIAARYFYDPWGRVLSVAGANPALAERQPLRYRGYYYDTETAMSRCSRASSRKTPSSPTSPPRSPSTSTRTA